MEKIIVSGAIAGFLISAPAWMMAAGL